VLKTPLFENLVKTSIALKNLSCEKSLVKAHLWTLSNRKKLGNLPLQGLSLQKANWFIDDPVDDSLVTVVMLSIDPLSVVVRLSVDSMSDVRVRLLMAVHPHEDEQGVQSVELDISARSQGKTWKKLTKFHKFSTKQFLDDNILETILYFIMAI